jgi:hypothetical protein
MKSLFLPFSLIMILFMTACSKSDSGGHHTGTDSTGSTKPNYPFANTEYNGISTQVSEFYEKPLAIRFNADSTVSAYSCFSWALGGPSNVLHDSIHGKITAVSSDATGATAISVTFDSTGDQQTMTISADKTGLTGGSISGSPAPGATQFQYVGLKLYSDTAHVGGSWTTDTVNVGGGYVENWYPDVATFSFFTDSFTRYNRNGEAYPSGPGTTPAKARYWQYGSRVYFYGLNENYARLIPYFGVLSSDGTYMYVDTQDTQDARIPTPFQTSDEYGPADVTPMIHKEYVGTLP